MANYLKTDPVGRDVKLQLLQKALYELTKVWGSPPVDFDMDGYGRAYFTEEDNKSILEAYLQNKDYSGNLLTTDRNKFFFYALKKAVPEGNRQYKQLFDLLFTINTQQAKPLVNHIADEELHVDVERILKQNSGLQLEIVDFDDNVQTIFKNYEFRYLLDIDFDAFDSMQPYHIFKFGISLVYDMQDTEENCSTN